MATLDLNQEAALWIDSEAYAKSLADRFTERVNADEELNVHRTFIEKRGYGLGERCFHWLWKLIVDEMPPHFRFLEVGVYKGQVLSLVRLLADRTNREAEIVGITLLSSFAGVAGKFPDFPERDYRQDITDLHDHFGLVQPALVVGDSTDPQTQQHAAIRGEFDAVYIDGGHEYAFVSSDLSFYPTLLKPGGLLIVDDASCYLEQPWGFFQGIDDVCRAVRTIVETNPDYEHLLAVVHNRVWRRV